jgi:Second Messenger Oligonucleotide or Dinucleotide Synthetase domain
MARTVTKAFDEFLTRLTPLESEREARAKHKDDVEAALRNSIEIGRFLEIGSFHHGTGIRRHCDVDLLVCIKSAKPGSSDTALGWVKNALTASFPNTRVRVSRPAVVIEFANGTEAWKVIPGFSAGRGDDNVRVYEIPGAETGWMGTAPEAHASYLDEINSIGKVSGGAKKLARLAKAWRYYNEVPISSFYLEMRAAEYISGEETHIPVWDICGLLQKLDQLGLAPMKDPKTVAGQFDPCLTPGMREEAVSKLRRGANRARKAIEAYHKEEMDEVFYYLDLLFGGNFPSRY